jgi:sugar lactone lactonase YvrE
MHRLEALLLGAVGAVLLTAAAVAAPPDSAGRIEVDGNQPAFPESITSTADGTLYTSSVGLGRIFKAAPGAAKATAWSKKPAKGPQSILGVYADGPTDTLWACYSDMALSKGNSGKPAVLKAFSLASGKVKHRYPMPAKSFCNDVVTTAQGTLYASDTHGGRIMRLRKGAGKLDTWFQDKRLTGVDGITLGPNGGLLLTNVNTNKLYRLAIKSDGSAGTLTELQPSHPLEHPDGLRAMIDGAIYLAENKAGRVDRLSINGDRVTLTTVASGYHGPTSMTLHGDTLYIVEAKINQFGKTADPSPFYIYPVRLPAR